MAPFLIPKFLQQLDRHLLLNHRLLWETRAHYVAFYGGIGLIMAVCMGLFMPLSLNEALPETEMLIIIPTVSGILALGFWLWRQSQHSILKEFGRQAPLDGHWRLLIYWAIMLVFAAPAYIIPELALHRSAQLISIEEMRQDIQTLNLAEPFFSRTNNYNAKLDDYLQCSPDAESSGDFSELFEYFSEDRYAGSRYDNKGYLTLASIHNASKKEFYASSKYKAQIMPAIEQYLAVMAKYGARVPMNAEEIWKSHMALATLSYDIEDLKRRANRQFQDISYCKDHAKDHANDAGIPEAIIASLLFALAVMIYGFKSVSLRDALAGMAAGIAAMIGILFIGAGFSGLFDNRGILGFFAAILLLYFASFAITLQIKGNGAYSVWHAMGLLLFNFASPFVLFIAILSISQSGLDAGTGTMALISSIAVYFLFIFSWANHKFKLLAALPRQ